MMSACKDGIISFLVEVNIYSTISTQVVRNGSRLMPFLPFSLKFFHPCYGHVVFQPFLYGLHVIFGSDDCRIAVYRGEACGLVVIHPLLQAVHTLCADVLKHTVQNLDGFAESDYQRVITVIHRCASFLSFTDNHPLHLRRHSSKVGATQENSSPSYAL